MALKQGVQVEGLKEFRSALKAADSRFVAEFREAGKEAAEHVAGPARASAQSQGGVAAKAGASLKAGGDAKGGFVRLGGAAYPFAMGAEFGAGHDVERNTSRGGVKGWNQFKPWRGSGASAGYFLYPTLRDRHDEILESFGAATDRISAEAFPS